MGISSVVNRKSYTGDGSSTIFSFPYMFFNAADLQVYLYDTNSSLVTAQTLSTNYTISGAQNAQGIYPNGGNVVMNSAFPSSLQIVITRAPALTDAYQLIQNGPINSVALVQQLDYLTTLVQRAEDQIARTVQIPDGLGLQNNSSFGVVLPSTVFNASSALSVLQVNSGASGIGLAVIPGLGAFTQVNQGGTGVNQILPVGGIWYTLNGSTLGISAAGSATQVLLGNGSGAPQWGSVSLGSSVAGILGVSFGGTGTATSYIQYGVVFASSATQFADTAAGGQDQALIGQAGAAPIFGQINLASGSSVKGALAIGFGGTGSALANLSQWGVLYASSATQVSVVPPAATGLPLLANASSAPSFQLLNLASGVTGQLSVGLGGTNTSSFTQYALIYAPTSTQLGSVPSATSGLPLLAQGSSSPVFQALGISGGGTGQTTQAAAFNALSPNTTQGDISWYQAGSNVRLGVGTTNQILTVGSGSSLTWNSLGNLSPGSVTTKNATYNATTSDNFIEVTSSGFTVNLYGVSGNTGREITITKTDNTAGNIVVAGSSASINGTSIILAYQHESVRLFCDGTNWQIQSLVKQPTVIYFPNVGSGTYVPSTGVTSFNVECVGGGGGGGGSIAGSSTTGGGGGGGGWCMKYINNVGSSYPYVIGSGGAGGVAGNNAGITGSSTIFGSSVLSAAMVAGGGVGGGGGAVVGATPVFGSVGAAGGTATGGDQGFNNPGQNGYLGIVLSLTIGGGQGLSGAGGASQYSTSAAPVTSSGTSGANGNPGNGPGGGGSGGISNSGSARSGGNAIQGTMIIREYYG